MQNPEFLRDFKIENIKFNGDIGFNNGLNFDSKSISDRESQTKGFGSYFNNLTNNISPLMNKVSQTFNIGNGGATAEVTALTNNINMMRAIKDAAMLGLGLTAAWWLYKKLTSTGTITEEDKNEAIQIDAQEVNNSL